jgi:hypothetical protein
MADFESELLKRDTAAFLKEFLYGRHEGLPDSSSGIPNCIRNASCHAVQQ